MALTLVAFGVANAADYYVKTTGSDGAGGTTPGTAWQTIQKAVTVSVGTSVADTIHVYKGVYGENISIDNSGNKGALTLWGGEGHTAMAPTIQANSNDSVIKICNGSSGITIQNFVITGGNVTATGTGNGGGIWISYGGWSTGDTEIVLKDLVITKNRASGHGGGLYATHTKLSMDNCCVHKNDANNGGGLYVDWPGNEMSETPGCSFRDCVVFHNHAVLGGGGIYLNQDDNFSMIYNCLIRQNLNGAASGGVHAHCADAYIKNCTIADNYYAGDFGFVGYADTWDWSNVPLWGSGGSASPSTDAYGVYSDECSGCYVRMINDIVYYNGKATTDDLHDSAAYHEIEAWYCDVQGSGYGTAGDSCLPDDEGNMDCDPRFRKSDDFGSYQCNSTLYFLQTDSDGTKSDCVDAGIGDDYDDPRAGTATPWGADAGDHCELVNTKSASKTTPWYSVHYDHSEDVEHYCDNGSYGGDSNAVDMGYHYRFFGCSYIELASFTAKADAGKVVLKWETATEIDNAGFMVYRCDNEASGCHSVSRFIAANGDAVGGATYSFTDTNVRQGQSYYYYLVDIDTSGEWTAHGPVLARLPVALRLMELPTAWTATLPTVSASIGGR